MIKTDAVRYIEWGLLTRIETLWIPDSWEFGKEPKWISENENQEPSVPHSGSLQGCEAW